MSKEKSIVKFFFIKKLLNIENKEKQNDESKVEI